MLSTWPRPICADGSKSLGLEMLQAAFWKVPGPTFGPGARNVSKRHPGPPWANLV